MDEEKKRLLRAVKERIGNGKSYEEIDIKLKQTGYNAEEISTAYQEVSTFDGTRSSSESRADGPAPRKKISALKVILYIFIPIMLLIVLFVVKFLTSPPYIMLSMKGELTEITKTYYSEHGGDYTEYCSDVRVQEVIKKLERQAEDVRCQSGEGGLGLFVAYRDIAFSCNNETNPDAEGGNVGQVTCFSLNAGTNSLFYKAMEAEKKEAAQYESLEYIIEGPPKEGRIDCTEGCSSWYHQKIGTKEVYWRHGSIGSPYQLISADSETFKILTESIGYDKDSIFFDNAPLDLSGENFSQYRFAVCPSSFTHNGQRVRRLIIDNGSNVYKIENVGYRDLPVRLGLLVSAEALSGVDPLKNDFSGCEIQIDNSNTNTLSIPNNFKTAADQKATEPQVVLDNSMEDTVAPAFVSQSDPESLTLSGISMDVSPYNETTDTFVAQFNFGENTDYTYEIDWDEGDTTEQTKYSRVVTVCNSNRTCSGPPGSLHVYRESGYFDVKLFALKITSTGTVTRYSVANESVLVDIEGD